MTTNERDWARAFLVARVGLGINIALHGWTRIPKFAAFSASLQEQFTVSPLPAALVKASAYGIVAAESIIGPLLLSGLFLRPALIAGSVLICTLLFGVCLVQNWGAAGTQMVYLAFFSALIATARFDRFSLDAWWRGRSVD